MSDLYTEERRTVKSLADLIQNRFGAKTDFRVSDPVFNVDIAVTAILPVNPKRFGMVIVNMSANTIYVSPDNHPTNNHGWVLVPNGGTIHFNWIEDFQLCMLPMYGTATANNSECFWLEVFCV